jgi:hypothetical protein
MVKHELLQPQAAVLFTEGFGKSTVGLIGVEHNPIAVVPV